MKPISIMIVDDHPLMREALCMALSSEDDFEVLDDVGSAEEALMRLEEISPDVVIMDITLPQMNGIEATKLIIKKDPTAKILMNSSMEDEAQIVLAMQAGALGYYPKTAPRAYLLQAIRLVADGIPYMPAGVAKTFLHGVRSRLDAVDKSNEKYTFTPRQEDIIRCLVDGKTDMEIAESLGLSAATVRSHIFQIRQRVGVSNRAQLVAYVHKKHSKA